MLSALGCQKQGASTPPPADAKPATAAAEQKAQGHQQALAILNQIAETRPQIRSDMVAKYKVEF